MFATQRFKVATGMFGVMLYFRLECRKCIEMESYVGHVEKVTTPPPFKKKNGVTILINELIINND